MRENKQLKGEMKLMTNFSTNWILYKNPRTKKVDREVEESDNLRKEMQKKIRLIQKAFC